MKLESLFHTFSTPIVGDVHIWRKLLESLDSEVGSAIFECVDNGCIVRRGAVCEGERSRLLDEGGSHDVGTFEKGIS